MGVADYAKTLNLSVEQFFHWSYSRAGHLYQKELPPDKAFEQYKFWGKLPMYVVSQMRSLKLAETFRRIREKYTHVS